jgi:hypothetical protein
MNTGISLFNTGMNASHLISTPSWVPDETAALKAFVITKRNDK